MYTEKELVGIAKRENNNKRKYLVVNKLQAKHVPVSPKVTLDMFTQLSDILKQEYKDKSLLLIGFAETATAIGAAIAASLDTFYMQTTRENIGGVEYLYFSETHSHATEQKLIKTDLDKVIDKVDRVIFIEDEITTGNTILNIINIMEKEYAHKIEFSVASLLNGMNEESRQVYDERNIKIHYLVKTNHDQYTAIAEKYKGDGSYSTVDGKDTELKTFTLSNYVNARRLNKGYDYLQACENLWQQVKTQLGQWKDKKVLVVGTEEFMYPAIFVAEKIERDGNDVKCHSTTRSPIEVSTEEDYPLHKRYELSSLYDSERKTFIYDIGMYDEVIIITDAVNDEKEGVNSLVNAIYSCGNNKISLIRWC